MSTPLAPRGPLGHPQFVRYWLARLATTVAAQIQVVAVGWQMYELTGSAMALGLVGLMQFAPSALLMFAVGPVVDRFDRRRILMTCRVIEGSAAIGLAVASANGWLDRNLIFGFVFLIGASRSFDMPAAQAILSSLVPAPVLSRAVAMSSSAHQAATIVGPAIGGLLYVAGPEVVYATSGSLFFVACVLLSLIRPGRSNAGRPKVTIEYLFAGIRFIRHHPVLLGAISLDMFAVLLGGATALLPIYAKDILHTGPWGLGLLRSAPAVGALTMAVLLARRPLDRKVGRLLLGAVGVFGLATLVFAVSRWLPLSLLALIALGGSDMVSVVVRMSLVQLETPDEMRGRVGAVNSLFIGASNQIGEFESGVTAAWFGTVASVIIGGVGTLLIVVLWARWFPELARRDRMTGNRDP